MNIINLTMGDVSGDGYGRFSNWFIQTYFTDKEIKQAYNIGTKIIGFDFSETVCSEYEDCKIPLDKLKILNEKGLNWELYDDQDEIWLDRDQFVAIYLFICKFGSPNFFYTVVEIPSIPIGGYGLFSD